MFKFAQLELRLFIVHCVILIEYDREAGCTPFATSLIADYFGEELRGLAMGVYNWGIYTGYSLSYALGNFVTDANINNQGWRW